MAEYVNKQELLNLLKKKIKADNERRMAVVDSDFIDLVNDATEINDVVEVVRCKDCAFYVVTEGFLLCNGRKPRFCTLQSTLKGENDYCSNGKRREGGEV